MRILGLNDSNSAATLLVDGQVIAAAREERFDRIKFSDSYPTQAVEYCLKEADIALKELDVITFGWNPGHELEPQDSAAAIRYHKHFLHYVPNNLLRHVRGAKENKRISSISETVHFMNSQLEIKFVPHHYCHAATSFFTSPYEKAAVITLDAYGDDITNQCFVGEGNCLESIGQTLFPHSLGQVYAAITQYLGYRANSDEWKVMGLAAYGEPEYYDQFKKIVRFDRAKGELRFDLDYFTYYIWSPRRYSDQFIKLFGPERYYGDELTTRHINIACSFQKRVEDVVLQLCDYVYKKTKIRKLCLGGGVFMNSKMNGRILLESPFEKVWVPSGSDDAGCSLGSALYWHHIKLKGKRISPINTDYFGSGYSQHEIREVLDSALLEYEELDNPFLTAAKAIAEGRIIGWFQGRMEYGQRALGNRSIIADPRDINMKDKINSAVKHREWYRPFAPSVLAEHQSDIFESGEPCPFMQLVLPIKKEKQKLIPAVVHKDGTGRLQSVTHDGNPRYWSLINEFYKLTGIPLVLNTSFNDNDEPIVRTPKEAIRTFFSTGLEELYIGDFRIRKQN